VAVLKNGAAARDAWRDAEGWPGDFGQASIFSRLVTAKQANH
jgi:hypothetical protein